MQTQPFHNNENRHSKITSGILLIKYLAITSFVLSQEVQTIRSTLINLLLPKQGRSNINMLSAQYNTEFQKLSRHILLKCQSYGYSNKCVTVVGKNKIARCLFTGHVFNKRKTKNYKIILNKLVIVENYHTKP